jgi:hypothetical protein
MDGYVPTPKEFDEVSGQLVELAKDYLLLYRMNGRQSIVDMHIDCSDKAEEALQAAKDLMAQVNRIDVLADTDAEALGRIWPDVLDILENYSFHHVIVETGVEVGVHEFFKPLWVAAKNLGLSDGEIEEAAAKLRRGRTPLISDSEFPQLYFEKYEQAKLAAEYLDERLTKDDVGRALGLDGRKSLQNYLNRLNLPWPPKNSS